MEMDTRGNPDQRPLAERRMVLAYLTLCCLTLAYAIYAGYGSYFAEIHSGHPEVTQDEYYRLHSTIAVAKDHPLFRGEDFAPDQYRVGVVFAGKYLGDRLGITKYYLIYPVFDFFCALGVGLLSYRALTASESFLRLGQAERGLAVVFLLLALSYPFAWTVPWERPETLPSALYLVFCVRSIRRGGKWLLAGLWAATAWQSFVRTDIPLVLGISLMALGCAGRGLRRTEPGWTSVAAGASIAGIAAAVQAYLQLVRFPAAAYPPGEKMLHLLGNLQPRQLAVFAVAMLPWAVLMVLLARHRKAMESADALAALASCLYLPLWWTVGILGEVRLFVPFLLALAPTAAMLLVMALREGAAEQVIAS